MLILTLRHIAEKKGLPMPAAARLNSIKQHALNPLIEDLHSGLPSFPATLQRIPSASMSTISPRSPRSDQSSVRSVTPPASPASTLVGFLESSPFAPLLRTFSASRPAPSTPPALVDLTPSDVIALTTQHSSAAPNCMMWTVDDVELWLQSKHFNSIAFECKKQKVNGMVLLSCRDFRDLNHLGACLPQERMQLHQQIENLASSTSHQLPIDSPTATFRVPEEFICPITQEVMDDPVIATDGFTYERRSIESWLTKCKTSPITREPLSRKSLVPNLSFRQLILHWKDEHGLGQQ
jgi:hypothetical protein